jgi:hypothetical protein
VEVEALAGCLQGFLALLLAHNFGLLLVLVALVLLQELYIHLMVETLFCLQHLLALQLETLLPQEAVLVVMTILVC